MLGVGGAQLAVSWEWLGLSLLYAGVAGAQLTVSWGWVGRKTHIVIVIVHTLTRPTLQNICASDYY